MVFYFDENDQYTNKTYWVQAGNTWYINKNQKFRVILSLNISAPASQVDDIVDIINDFTFKIEKPCGITNEIESIKFEHGSLYQGADDDFNKLGRARTVGIVSLSFDSVLSISDGSFVVHYFDDEDNFTGTSSWITNSKMTVSANQKFRLIVTEAPGKSAFEELSSIVSRLTITKPEEAVNSFSLTPNIQFACRNVDDTAIPPESIWAVKAAANNQYDRIRFTVRRTTDGYYFNCHDTTINNFVRNADGSVLTETVNAEGHTLAELDAYDWGIKYGSKYAGAKTPLLEDCLKYAAMFNIAVTWHATSAAMNSEEVIADTIELMDKYGLTDRLLIISSGGNDFQVFNQCKAHNENISYFIGAPSKAWVLDESNTALIDGLLTGKNHVYLQYYANGSWVRNEKPDYDVIAHAKAHGWEMYNSTSMSESDLLNPEMFNHGFTMIECNNVRNVKDTVRNWANSLVS